MIQVDSQRRLHADFDDLLLTKSTTNKHYTLKSNINNIALTRPLNTFSSFDTSIWNTLVANNSSSHTSSISISSSPHSNYCNNKLLAIGSLHNSITTWG